MYFIVTKILTCLFVKLGFINYASRHHINASLNSVSGRSSLVWFCVSRLRYFLDTPVDGRPLLIALSCRPGLQATHPQILAHQLVFVNYIFSTKLQIFWSNNKNMISTTITTGDHWDLIFKCTNFLKIDKLCEGGIPHNPLKLSVWGVKRTFIRYFPITGKNNSR